ncbi:MAG: 50S ribosomal protein L18 [Steroidobacteraceae bacterium]
MITKKSRRLRRAAETRARIAELGVARLTVHRTPQHIYAQLMDATGAKVLAAASTLQEAVRAGLKGTGNVDAAQVVGRVIAERAKAAGVTRVAFDRSGFRFHGRVKALADAARAAGLEF